MCVFMFVCFLEGSVQGILSTFYLFKNDEGIRGRPKDN